MTTATEHPLVQSLRARVKRFEIFVARRERAIFLGGIISFIFVFTTIAAWKVWAGAYNALDLAIYRQVAANSIRGDFFGLTINPHSYLGDHVELFFAVLWPFYALVKHPLTLLLLQNIALALAAWPIAKIAARLLGQPWSLLFALAYLANPMVQNIALFEFHMLPFAIPVLLFAILAYIDRQFGRFMLLSLLAMTVREDVALVIIGFGLLAMVDRRHWRWSALPITLGLVWFVGALRLTAFFSGYEQYKFLAYYQWLGDSPGAMLQTIITKPWLIVQHILQISRLGLALMLLLPFAFLPLLSGRWLIPVIPIIAQIFLGGATGDAVTGTHYPSLLLPFLLVAVMAVFSALRQPPAGGLTAILGRERVATITIYCSLVVYVVLLYGPLIKSVPIIASSSWIAERVNLQKSVISSLPAGGVVAGPEDLAGLADRPRLYSLHYVWLGQKQFSEESYTLPNDAAVVLLDQRDFLTLQAFGPNKSKAAGYSRIRSTLADRGFIMTAMIDRYSIWERRPGSTVDFSALWSATQPILVRDGGSQHGPMTFIGWSAPANTLAPTVQEFNGQRFRVAPFDLVWSTTKETDVVYQLEFSFRQSGRIKHRVLMPLGGGLFPTSDWPVNAPITSHYRLLIPAPLHGLTEIQVRVLDLESRIGLNGVRSATPIYTKYEPVGPTIELGTIEL